MFSLENENRYSKERIIGPYITGGSMPFEDVILTLQPTFKDLFAVNELCLKVLNCIHYI